MEVFGRKACTSNILQPNFNFAMTFVSEKKGVKELKTKGYLFCNLF